MLMVDGAPLQIATVTYWYDVEISGWVKENLKYLL
jgi:hypothetical protein